MLAVPLRARPFINQYALRSGTLTRRLFSEGGRTVFLEEAIDGHRGISALTLHRPHAKNAISVQMLKARTFNTNPYCETKIEFFCTGAKGRHTDCSFRFIVSVFRLAAIGFPSHFAKNERTHRSFVSNRVFLCRSRSRGT